MADIHLVSCSDAAGAAEKALLLDVRTPAEFAEAHIAGSVLHPLSDLDAAAVVMALSCLAVDPDLRAAMGHAARQRYEAGFSAETMWEAYLELYQNLYEARHGVV